MSDSQPQQYRTKIQHKRQNYSQSRPKSSYDLKKQFLNNSSDITFDKIFRSLHLEEEIILHPETPRSQCISNTFHTMADVQSPSKTISHKKAKSIFVIPELELEDEKGKPNTMESSSPEFMIKSARQVKFKTPIKERSYSAHSGYKSLHETASSLSALKTKHIIGGGGEVETEGSFISPNRNQNYLNLESCSLLSSSRRDYCSNGMENQFFSKLFMSESLGISYESIDDIIQVKNQRRKSLRDIHSSVSNDLEESQKIIESSYIEEDQRIKLESNLVQSNKLYFISPEKQL